MIFKAGPQPFSTPTPSSRFSNTPNGDSALTRADFPFQIRGPGRTSSQVANYDSPPASFDYFLTLRSWAPPGPVFSLPETPVGNVEFAGKPRQPHRLRRGEAQLQRRGLFRIQKLFTSETVERALSPTRERLSARWACSHNGQGLYAVFGVDPQSPDHLFAPYIGRAMQASADGGARGTPSRR